MPITTTGTGVPLDSSAPSTSSRTVPISGTTLVVVFSEVVKGFIAGDNGFTLTSSSTTVTLSYLSGNTTNTITFTTSRTIGVGEVLTLTYVAGSITDLANNPLASFSNISVTNNSTQPPVNTLLAPGANPILAPSNHFILVS